jgi:hypothetical protein
MALSGSPFAPGVITEGGAFDPTGKLFYSGGTGGTILAFSADPTSGALAMASSSLVVAEASFNARLWIPLESSFLRRWSVRVHCQLSTAFPDGWLNGARQPSGDQRYSGDVGDCECALSVDRSASLPFPFQSLTSEQCPLLPFNLKF